MLSTILFATSMTLMYSAPLIFSAMGGVITMRSGVDNIGLEGMMTIGAFTGAAVGYFTANPWLGFLAAGLSGMLLALLHGIVSITLKGNQIISGIAINFIGPGISIFFTRLFFDGATQSYVVPNKLPKVLGSLGFSSSLVRTSDIDVTVVFAFILIIAMWYFLYKTRQGLRIRACGEHPAAADTMGINVELTRYLCVLASGFLAGLGG
ncbi:MAG: ABC transporter permease, partial [Gallicola sp.]|nr:ABC transporter permease [Gallicola sp.]